LRVHDSTDLPEHSGRLSVVRQGIAERRLGMLEHRDRGNNA
jgi:hypothetical protein